MRNLSRLGPFASPSHIAAAVTSPPPPRPRWPRSCISYSDEEDACSSGLGNADCCDHAISPPTGKPFWFTVLASKSFVRGCAKRSLWWLMLAVVAASLTARIFFSGPTLGCMVDPSLDTAHPAWNESATVPLRQFLLRRTPSGDGGSVAVAPWRMWGCDMGDRRGERAEVRAGLGLDSVVVRTSAEATGNLVGGSEEVEGEGAEWVGLGDGVAARGKGRISDAGSNKDGEKGGGETENKMIVKERVSHMGMEGGSGDVNEGVSAEEHVMGEFGYELIAVLPFAYWHHLNGSLRSTTSCGRHSLASLYYFSPNHTDDATCHRSDMKDNVTEYGFPHGIHYSRIPPTWQPPPLAQYFRKLPSVWPEISKGSRLVVIGNKYEREWGHSPVNFIDLPTLLGIVESYLDAGFYVVYNNPGMSLESDHRQVIRDGTDLGDYEALQKRFWNNPRLQIMQNLQKRWPDLGFNDVQFRMLAQSVCFVSVQGGGSIVESFFGGKNIIYFREGQEVKGRAYERIYPQLSGAKVKVVTSYEGLVKKVDGMIKKNKCHAKLH
ncbi:unnamed protein product [Closterium sp. Yama58-4]|nr:unnamed protein product [Closterium sp. Yama58-4]